MVVFEKKRPLYVSFILFIYVLYSLYICTTTCPLLVHHLSSSCPTSCPRFGYVICVLVKMKQNILIKMMVFSNHKPIPRLKKRFFASLSRYQSCPISS